MTDKLLFTKTYRNKRSNGTNKGYWTKFVSSLVSAKNDFIISSSMNSFNADMPIFIYFSSILKRGLIIYQYNQSDIKDPSLEYSKYLTAWTQRQKINDLVISILTIYLLPSKHNIEVSKELIKLWLLKKKGISKFINNIYLRQE